QGEPQPLAFDEDGLLNPLTQQCNWSAVSDARANEEENTHSCLQIGGTIFSSVMVQEACLKACGSGAVIHEPWFRGCGGFIQHQRLGMIPFQGFNADNLGDSAFMMVRKGKYAITADNTKAAPPQRAGNNHLVVSI
ncbi:hypothetical protein Tco_0443080, partial [Tanacetum coccineum]